MAPLKALRERKHELSRQANNLFVNVGDRTWTQDEQKSYDTIVDEIERLNAQIAALEKINDERAELVVTQELTSGKKKVEASVKDILALYLRKGANASAEELASIRNAMSTTTGSEGGFTVPTEVARTVIDALKAYGGMRRVAQIVPSSSGNAWSYPGSDGTAEEGEIVGENAAATTGEITFTTVPLVVYKYSSKKIALPWELVQDSGIDIVQFVIDRLATRIGRITNKHFTIGTGTSQPHGVVTRSGVGKVGSTGQTTTVTYDDLVDLQHAVDASYRALGAVFMMNDLTVRSIRKIKDTSNRPIFVPGYDVNSVNAPDTLLGAPIIVNNDVPVMAANAKSILYGSFQSYIIRDVMDVEVRRFDDSAFALNGQVGFCGWSRTGGNLMNTGAVRHYQNSAT